MPHTRQYHIQEERARKEQQERKERCSTPPATNKAATTKEREEMEKTKRGKGEADPSSAQGTTKNEKEV